MKIPKSAFRKAAARKRSQGEQQAPAPKRPARRAPSPPARQDPPAAPEIDLTGDSPAEEEATQEVAAGAPATEEMAATGEPPAPFEPVPSEPDKDWGEGPSGAADVPANPSPPSSHLRIESEAAGGSGIRAIPARDSVLNNLRWVEQLISPAIAPEIQEELSQLKSGAFFRESYAALAKMINVVAASREVIHTGKTMIREAQAEAEEARTRAEAAEGSLELVRTECSRKIKEAESKVEVADCRAAAAINQLTDAEGAVEARNIRIADLESFLQAARDQIKEAEEEGNRAREAERVAVAALAAGEARAAEVEAATEARVAQAIERFRASQEYVDELASAGADAYLEGFQRGKEKVAHDLNFPQALEVEPDRLSEVASDEDEARDDQ